METIKFGEVKTLWVINKGLINVFLKNGDLELTYPHYFELSDKDTSKNTYELSVKDIQVETRRAMSEALTSFKSLLCSREITLPEDISPAEPAEPAEPVEPKKESKKKSKKKSLSKKKPVEVLFENGVPEIQLACKDLILENSGVEDLKEIEGLQDKVLKAKKDMQGKVFFRDGKVTEEIREIFTKWFFE